MEALRSFQSHKDEEGFAVSTENKAIVRRWYRDFWGEASDLAVVDELASPAMLLRYSLYPPRRGRQQLKAFMSGYREAFPDLRVWADGELIAEGEHVVSRWEASGTHTGPVFGDLLMGTLIAASGCRMHFSGTTVFRIKGSMIVEEIGSEDGVTALGQMGLIPKAAIAGF